MDFLFRKIILYLIVQDHLFSEAICTCLGRFHHFNYFGMTAPCGCIPIAESRNCFLCHSLYLVLLDFFVYRHFLQHGIVFFQFQPLRGVFSVLCRNISGGAGHAARFVFCTFQNHLHPVTFCFFCHCCFLLLVMRLKILWQRLVSRLHPIQFY